MDRRLTAQVDCSGGAVMTISDPRSDRDGSAEWVMRYGNPEDVRFVVASLLASYDYLLSSEITAGEATRRLRLLRAARRELATR